MAEFQGLLFELMKQAIVGGLEVDEVVSFLNELISALVRVKMDAAHKCYKLCTHSGH